MRSVRIVLGMLLFCTVFYLVNGVLVRKSHYMDSIGRFLTTPDIEVDVVGFGSSHMYCTLNPIEMFRHTRLRSYVACTQQQPAEITYNYIKRVLTYHRPKVVLLETFMFFCQDAPAKIGVAVAHDALDPIPLDLDKFQLVCSSPYLADREGLIMPFLKYHSRWKELMCHDRGKGTISDKHDYSIMGFRLFGNVVSNEVRQINWNGEATDLDEYYVDKLNRIAQLVTSHGVQLVLLTVPYSPLTDAVEGRLRAIDKMAKEKGLFHVNLFRDFSKAGIGSGDFHDRGHLNVWGSEKATRYIGERLLGEFDLVVNDSAETLAIWTKECRRYDAMKEALARK